MKAKKHAFLTAAAELKQALALDSTGRERDWAERVDRALAALVAAVQRHHATLQAPSGGVVDVDNGRVPSPAVDRRLSVLYEELEGVLGEAAALRARLQRVLTSATAGELPDFTLCRRRAEELLDALDRYEADEADLILDSVTTDIGAGD
jgi:hypothetical protein